MKPTVYVQSLQLLERNGTRAFRDSRAPTSDLRLEERADGRLWAVRGAVAHPVTVRRLFPWSAPHQHVSLRDAEDREVALIRDAVDLDAVSSALLERALAEAGFLFEISRIYGIEEEIEIRNWRVATRQGDRTFQTKLDVWPRALPDGGVLIPDVSGDLYLVPDTTMLDPASRKLLWAYVD